MKKSDRAFWFTLTSSLLLTISSFAATNREAARHVATGIQKHQGGDFKGAEQEFAAAAKAQPDHPRILFDQACAASAQGKLDEAEKLFKKSKLARDPELAAASLYNLGHLSARRAMAKFGDRPEEAPPEIRPEGLKHIEQAVALYRSCLSVDPNHSNARHNLELLRLWVKHIQEVWKQRDRKKQREELDTLQFLERILAEQKAVRERTRALSQEEDSPKRRQAETLLGQRQRELSEEMDFLQKKLLEGLAASKSSDPNAPTDPSAQQGQAAETLTQLTLQGKNAMSRAATELASRQLAEAEESQTQTLQPLDDLYRIIAPFEHILRKAIQTEEKLIERTATFEEAKAQESSKGWHEQDLTYEQTQVTGWAESLRPKAEQAREAQGAAAIAGPAPPPNSSGNNAGDKVAAQQGAAATYAKAIELGPQAAEAAKKAAEHLDQRQWSDAKTKEEETLKLLKEIEKELPKQPDQNQNEQNDQQSEQKKQDQQQKKDESQQDKPKENPQKQKDPQQKPKEQKQDPSRQQAESILRQVREREREYREKQKAQVIIGGVKVEKDW